MDINLSRWAIENRAVVLFLIIVSSIAGFLSYQTLGRAEDPSFTIKTMIVQAIWPGATADNVQLLVAEPLEKRLQEIPELDYVKTYSRPGVAILQIQLKDSTRGRDVLDVWYQVRKKLGDSRASLPTGVIGPLFNDEYGEVFVSVHMLWGDGLTQLELKRYAEQAQKALLRVKDVAKVQLFGVLEDKIFVEVSTKKLATLGIPFQSILDALTKQNAVTATGAVETGADRVQVRVNGAFDGVSAISSVPIEAGGKTFRLGDIATVTRGSEDPPSNLTKHNGHAAVGIGVSMAAKANVLTLGENLNHAIEKIQSELPTGVVLDKIADQPHVVEASVSEFLESFAEALAIVLIVSFISLGWRTGIVVALSVPLVLSIVFISMAVGGLQLDRITLGALIIALGLLVDDAIIAVEMMMVKLEEGASRAEAATFAWTSTAFPMLTGTLVTIAGFLPVGFAKSTSGEYAGNIFTVVGAALIISWFVAVIFTPYLGYKLLPEVKSTHDHHAVYNTPTYRWLRALVRWSVRHRWTVIAATVVAFAFSIFEMTLVQKQFFPTSARPELFIETRMPEGTSIRATEQATIEAEALLKDDPDIRFYTTYVGQGAPRFFLALNPVLPNESFALTVIMAKDAAARDRVKARLEAKVAAGAVPQARLRIDTLVFGPPVGFPVQFRVMGPDPIEIRRIAYQVLEAMKTVPTAIAPQLDWNEQAKTVRLDIDQDRARVLGLSTQDVSQALATLLSGATVTQYRENTNLIDVVARAVPAERLSLEGLPDLTLQTKGGTAVPLSQIAKISYGFEEPILWRRNRDMTLTVRADVAPGEQAPTVSAAVLAKLDPLIANLPLGYRIEKGGTIEETEKANAAIFQLFPLMILVMLTLLMFQLRSFSKLALVFSTAPLGLIGAATALIVFNAPFGFVAILGVIALAGILMRNTVILVDQIDHDLAAGASMFDAIIESTVRRARPVVLTALAAILGLIPLAPSVFWGPLAKAMMGGLTIGTVLTLLFLPALYAAFFRAKETPANVSEPQRNDAKASLKIAAE